MDTTHTAQAAGRDWLGMRPAHFDAGLLPRRHRSDPEGLFPLADIAPDPPRAPRPVTPELDGQMDLFAADETAEGPR